GNNDGQNIITSGSMDIDIYTFGFSSIGVYDVGPGLADLFVWGAGQLGEFNGRDHAAGAGIFEAGYMLPDVPAKPWLRLGINVASGGSPDANDDHTTFHNLLPTNHPYYGFTDQLAFQNLMDLIAQLKLQLHEKVGLNLMYHHFRLLNSKDAQYFGTGAFSKQGSKAGAFGYGGVPATTHGFNKDVGDELDVVLTWKLNPHLSLEGGYAHLWGGDVFEAKSPQESDVQFGFLQAHFKY
ncbi:MAG TPA: alginate export family protein, partial [Myxococcota bacterium]